MDDETSTEDNSSDTQQPKKPSRRVKKWAPKTRTGCLTCRQRRVKCDERRPRCYRCQLKNRDCVYETASKVKSVYPRQLLGDTGESTEPHGRAHVLSLTPSYGDSESLRYLDVYRSLAAPWLDRYSEAGFFDGILPQLSWYHPALRHVLVAVSMASEQYYMGPDNTKPYRRMWHYQQALKHLYSDHQIQDDLVLSACILFWVHDNIMGDVRAALVHLKGILQLVVATKARKAHKGMDLSQIEQAILRGLVYWGHSADEGLVQRPDTDVISRIQYRLRDPNYGSILSTVRKIREESTLCGIAIQWGSNNVGQESEQTQATSISFDDLGAFTHKWYIHAVNSEAPLTDNDRIILECYHTLIFLALIVRRKYLAGGAADLLNDRIGLARLDYILKKIESIDTDSLRQRPGEGDFVLPLLPIVAEVGRLAPETSILSRASNLLRKMKRVECFWNSEVVAALLDTMAHTQRHGRERLTVARVKMVSEHFELEE